MTLDDTSPGSTAFDSAALDESVPDGVAVDGAAVDEALLDDLVLADRVRAGDMEAFHELWRRHWPAARAFARRFSDLADVDDLVQDAFIAVLDALRAGRGPAVAFRSYLFRTIQNGAVSSGRRMQAVPAGDRTDLETMRPGGSQGEDESTRVLERTVAADAFSTLPERWRTILWKLVVEDRPLPEVAAEVGLSENATAVLAKRAREGFRTAWLTAHTSSAGRPQACSWCVARLAKLERGTLTQKERTAVLLHLGDCADCRSAHAQVEVLAKDLRALLLPAAALLGPTVVPGVGGALASPVLSSTAALAGPGGSATAGHLVGGVRHLVHLVGSAGTSAAGVAAVSVTVVATVAALAVFGGDSGPEQPAPSAASQPAPSSSAEDVGDDLAPSEAAEVPEDLTSPASLDQLQLLPPEPEATPESVGATADPSAAPAEPAPAASSAAQELAPAVPDPTQTPVATPTESPRPITPTSYSVAFPAFSAPTRSTAFSVPVVVSNVGGTEGAGDVVLEMPVSRYVTVAGVSTTSGGRAADVSLDVSDPAVVRISLGTPLAAYSERVLLLDLVYGDPATWAHITPPNEGCSWARPRASLAAALAGGLPGAGTATGAASLVVPGSAACTAEP